MYYLYLLLNICIYIVVGCTNRKLFQDIQSRRASITNSPVNVKELIFPILQKSSTVRKSIVIDDDISILQERLTQRSKMNPDILQKWFKIFRKLVLVNRAINAFRGVLTDIQKFGKLVYIIIYVIFMSYFTYSICNIDISWGE